MKESEIATKETAIVFAVVGLPNKVFVRAAPAKPTREQSPLPSAVGTAADAVLALCGQACQATHSYGKHGEPRRFASRHALRA